jgi:Fic family protein
LNYDERLALALSRADAALSELSGLGRHLPNPHLLIAPYVHREAVLSSRIEGTQTNLSELFLDEIQPGATEQRPDDVLEVRNYVAAMGQGIQRLKKLRLSLPMVRELHERLMRCVRGEYATPGQFRRSQNWIGRPGSTVHSATYVPPPPERVTPSLRKWERFIGQRDRMPDLLQCALMHEHFEAIHPFLDGNGRIGRLLVPLFLIERGRLSQPLLYLSAYIEANRSEYYQRLQAIRTDGDWDGWLHYFLTGVAVTASEGVQRAGKLMDLREKYRSRLREKPKALLLIDQLFLNPYLTIARAAGLLKTTIPTARQAMAVLEKLGMLEETTGKKWGRVFLARPILNAIDSEEKRHR